MMTMKKRILALVLALTIIVGLGGQAWAEVLPAVGSPSPEVSTQPEESAAPEVTETPTESAAPEESETPQESTPPEEGETDDAPVETPILDEDYALPGVEDFAVTQPAPRASSLPAGEPEFPNHIVGGVSPVGTTINLFDYWISSDQFADDSGGNTGTGFLSKGINNGHAFLFGNSMDKNNNGIGTWNQWTGNGGGVYKGIVASELGADGYPQLYLTINNNTASQHVGKPENESLAYLFDPEVTHDGKESFADVQGLFQVDDKGYYSYDSSQNYAVYYKETNSFVLYKYPGVQDKYGDKNGQFFPFNAVGAENLPDDPGDYFFPQRTPEDSNLNHYFGVHMSTRFIQPEDGYVDQDKEEPVTYEFSGDDDVWIFIDGILVADLGGIHDKASVTINFVTGKITINDKEESKTLGAKLGLSQHTLPDNTYHTLDFFYLERGNVESNMKLKYNLVSVPESSIVKVDQTGDPVPGAKFSLFLADENWLAQNTAIATGITDANGQFVLLDENESLISLQKLWDAASSLKYNISGETRANLILSETESPPGYRSAGQFKLYMVESGGQVLLLSEDHWTTGAYAYANSTISMGGNIQYKKDSTSSGRATLEPDGSNGLLFAVVLRRTTKVGTNAPAEGDTWKLVTGNPTDGWNTSGKVEAGQTGIETILQALKETGNSDNYFVAHFDASGAWKTTVSELPGDVMTYYHMLDANNKAQTEYIVAFYYTTAGSVEAATVGNTYRVTNSDSWEREFSSNVYVPNIKNRLLVQKVVDTGATVTGAVFSLYRDSQVRENRDGTVTVKTGEIAYDAVTTADLSKENGNGINLKGGGIFPTEGHILEDGTYYLVESSAPGGYQKNTVASKIVVDNTGVYADAGEENDGIVVARGVGSIVKSMAQFAALGDINASLNNIVAKFYTVDELPAEAKNFEGFTWRSLNANGTAFEANTANGVSYLPSYMVDEETREIQLYDASQAEGKQLLGLHMEYSMGAGLEYGPEKSISDNLGVSALFWMTTDTGWSKLMMEQCYEHSRELTKQGYNVTDLTGPKLYDLTNLFSGTVIVQVTNQRTGNLKISKTVKADNNNAPADDSFTFTVTVTDGTTPISGTYKTLNQDGGKGTIGFTGGSATVTLGKDESLTILALPTDAIYEVVETNVPNGYTPSVTVTGDEKARKEGATATGTIQHNTTDTDAVVLAYTNDYKEMQTLTVTKTVGGNMGDTTKPFAFTLEITDTKGTPYKSELTVHEGPIGGTGADGKLNVSGGSSSYTFDLKHNEQIAISIPKGYTAKVTETAVDGYTTNSRQYGTGTTAPQYTENMVAQSVIMDNNYTVDYENVLNMATPSGVDTPTTGISVMMGVAAASAVIIFGCSFLMWRRRRRDWM